LLTEVQFAVIPEPAEIETFEQLEPNPLPLSVAVCVAPIRPCAGDMLFSAGATVMFPLAELPQPLLSFTDALEYVLPGLFP
jgi:hypothetical protein